MRFSTMLSAPLAVLSLALIVAPTSADEPAPRASITVKLSALRSAKGKVGCALYDSARGFPKDASAARQQRWSPVDGATATCQFDLVPRGTYAVVCMHDENENGKLDSSWLGIPTEGLVVSNHAEGTFGPPSFTDAKFAFPGTPTELALTMKY